MAGLWDIHRQGPRTILRWSVEEPRRRLSHRITRAHRDWIQSDALELRKGIEPAEASERIDDGWFDPDSGEHRTLGSVWTDCFRHEIKEDPTAATAQMFGTLAKIYGDQTEIRDLLEDLARKMKNRDATLLAEIKAALPTSNTLEKLVSTPEEMKGDIGEIKEGVGEVDKKLAKVDDTTRLILEKVNALVASPRPSSEPELSAEERWSRAVAEVAEREHLEPLKLQEDINLFVSVIKNNPNSRWFDRSLAEFAELRLIAIC